MLKQGMAGLILALLPAGLGTSLARSEDPPKAQDEQLEGDWEMVSAVRDGKDLPSRGNGKTTVTIKGDKMSWRVGDDVFEDSIAVDASKTPKTIDSVAAGGTGAVKHGVYEVKDDILRICIGPPGKQRPNDLSPKEGSGYGVLTFKRIKK